MLFMTLKNIFKTQLSASLRKVDMLSKKLWCHFKDGGFGLDWMRRKSKGITGVTWASLYPGIYDFANR